MSQESNHKSDAMPDESKANNDMECLLTSMSLKEPSLSLDIAIEELGQSNRMPEVAAQFNVLQSWYGLAAVATAGILVGVLIGRNSMGIEKEIQDPAAMVAANDTDRNDLSLNDTQPLNQDGLANSISNSNSKSKISLVDQGLFFVNGRVPVRKYQAVSSESVQVRDAITGLHKQVIVPVRKTYVAPAPGI